MPQPYCSGCKLEGEKLAKFQVVSKKSTDSEGYFQGSEGADKLKIKRGDFTIDLGEDDAKDHLSFDNRGAGEKIIHNFDIHEDTMFFRMDGRYFNGADSIGGGNKARVEGEDDFMALLAAVLADNGANNAVSVDDGDITVVMDADNHFRGDLKITFKDTVSQLSDDSLFELAQLVATDHLVFVTIEGRRDSDDRFSAFIDSNKDGEWDTGEEREDFVSFGNGTSTNHAAAGPDLGSVKAEGRAITISQTLQKSRAIKMR